MIDPSERPATPAAARSRTGLLVAALLAAFLALLAVAEKRAPHNPEIDEGAYFASARLVAAGEPLYTSVFCSQVPLYLELLARVLRVCGDNVLVARAVSVAFAVAYLGLIGWLTARLIARDAAPFAVLCAALGLPFFYEARLGHPDLPAVTLGLGALALLVDWRRRGGAWRPAAAGVIFALAGLFKLFVAPLLVPAALLLLAGRDAGTQALGLQAVERRRAVRAALAFTLAGLVAGVAVMSRYDLPAFFQQAVHHHDAARDSAAGEPGRNLPLVLATLAVDPGTALLALTGAVVLVRRRRALAVGFGAWLAAVVAALMLHRPLYVHHVTLLLPVWSLLAGAAWLATRTPEGHRRRVALAAVLVAPFLALQPEARENRVRARSALPSVRVRPALAPLRNLAVLEAASARESDDDEMVRRLRERTPAGGVVVSDRPIQVFRADRRMPPELCDVGWKRIASGLLDDAGAIALSRDAHAVVLWTGRLESLRGFVAWVESHFHLVQAFPDGPRGEQRRLYVRPGA